ncbi:MAG: hypothetical protein U1F58_07655 [Burkholderiales bacterium]
MLRAICSDQRIDRRCWLRGVHGQPYIVEIATVVPGAVSGDPRGVIGVVRVCGKNNACLKHDKYQKQKRGDGTME